MGVATFQLRHDEKMYLEDVLLVGRYVYEFTCKAKGYCIYADIAAEVMDICSPYCNATLPRKEPALLPYHITNWKEGRAPTTWA